MLIEGRASAFVRLVNRYSREERMPPKRKGDLKASPRAVGSPGSPSLALTARPPSPSSVGSPGRRPDDEQILRQLMQEFPALPADSVREVWEKAIAAGHGGRVKRTLRTMLADALAARQLGTPVLEPAPEPAPMPLRSPPVPRGPAMEQDWREMNKRNQKYAEDLGWTQQTWDGGDETPFDALWTEMDQKKRDAVAALGFDRSQFSHAHDSEEFWQTIAQVQGDGLVGMNVAHTVQRELNNVELLWGHDGARDPAESVRLQLTELLSDLSEFEGICEDIRNTAEAREGEALGVFEDMKNRVLLRDDKAHDLFPRVEGMLKDLKEMEKTLQQRCADISACQSDIQQAGARMEDPDEQQEDMMILDRHEMQVRLPSLPGCRAAYGTSCSRRSNTRCFRSGPVVSTCERRA